MMLPDKLPGHWETPPGFEMAKEYAGVLRCGLAGAINTDMTVAHKLGFASSSDQDLLAVLTMGKDRVRWLSVQLAMARILLGEASEALNDGLESDEGELEAPGSKTDRVLVKRLDAFLGGKP